MKNLVYILLLALNMAVNAQVSINTDGSLPDNSAMLDVKSTTRGVLVPRMTTVQRDAIVNPATGLLIFCTDNNLFYSNKGTPATPNWVILNSKWLSNGANIYFTGGNVGVGTTTPDAPLSIANTSLGGIATAGSFQIGQSNTNNIVCDNNEVQARYNGTGSILFLQYWGGDISACTSGGTASFYGPVNMLSNLNVSGKIGIKTDPSYDLHINSSDYTAGYITTTYPGCTAFEVIATSNSSGTWGLYSFATTAGYAGYFSGNVYCSGAYLPSDEKLKENIQPLNNGLDKIMKLDVKTFNFKTTEYPELNLPAEKQNGFIAQNLENVFPELVKFNPAKKQQPIDFKAVNYIGMIPVLTEAIQEQQKQMEAKDKRIDNLQKQYDDLQRQLNDLKAQVMNVQQKQ